MCRNGVIDVIVGYEHAGDEYAGRSSLRSFAIPRQSLSLEMPTICSRKSCDVDLSRFVPFSGQIEVAAMATMRARIQRAAALAMRPSPVQRRPAQPLLTQAVAQPGA